MNNFENIERSDLDNSINSEEIKNFKSVNKIVFQKLEENQLLNIRTLVMCQADELVTIGLTKARAEAVIAECKDNLFCSFQTAEDVFKYRQTKKKLKFFVSSLDTLLRGGLETGALTEIHGEFGTGKTQISHHLSVVVQKIDENSVNGSVVYIDTEGTFRPDKLSAIAQRFGLDPKEVRENIYHLQPTTADQLCHIMDRLNTEKFETVSNLKLNKPIKLVIIDSVIKHFRSEYIGRGMLADRQQRLSRFLNTVNNFALKNDVVVILVNQVSANPDSLFGPSLKPVGGHILHHTATYRLGLKKSKGIGNRTMSIVDAPDLPPSSAQYTINEKGIMSIQNEEDEEISD